MTKRDGRGGNVVEMELDLEVGWACQLLAKFGTRVELSLEDGCAGLTYLLKNGVPISHVDAVRANYRGELITARSAGFEDGIRRLIFHFEIDDTAINRERAMSKMLKAAQQRFSTFRSATTSSIRVRANSQTAEEPLRLLLRRRQPIPRLQILVLQLHPMNHPCHPL